MPGPTIESSNGWVGATEKRTATSESVTLTGTCAPCCQ
jgi:hypothetical protein